MKIAQDRQKSCVDRKITPGEFKDEDHVYVRVRPRKSFLRMGSCAKLEPRYCGPFEVLYRVGPVAYRISPPPTVRCCDVIWIVRSRKVVDCRSDVNELMQGVRGNSKFPKDLVVEEKIWAVEIQIQTMRSERRRKMDLSRQI
jgi:hypothetical protein